MKYKTEDPYALGLALGRVFNAVTSTLTNKLAEAGFDLTASQFAVLYKIYGEEGLNQTKIALLIKKDNAAVSRAVKSLVEKGYLTKGSASLHRKSGFYLTEKAKVQKDAILSVERNLMEQCYRDIPESRQKIIIKVLQRIYVNCMHQ